MRLIEAVRYFQNFNPATGGFDCERNDLQYAAALGLERARLSAFFNGHVRLPISVICALARFIERQPGHWHVLIRALAEDGLGRRRPTVDDTEEAA